MAGLIERLKFLFTGRRSTAPVPSRRARYDAAQTTPENRKHWAEADALSANSSLDPSTRHRLRVRSRYEAANNCYAKGAVRSRGADMVGTGPSIQITVPGLDSESTKRIEQSFSAWSDAIKLAIRLRVADYSLVRCGEAFGIFGTDPRAQHAVKLNIRWVEPEQCTTPTLAINDKYVTDGIRFDEFGSPVEYYFLIGHPGDLNFSSQALMSFETVPAENVIHWFAQDRIGQNRGIPELTQALPLYSQLRRFRMATLTAAEFAAMIAGVLETNLPPDTGSVQLTDAWDQFEMVRGALLSLPAGQKATQMKAEHPTSTHGEFSKSVLGESGRATAQPRNVITGDSGDLNYSSGRLDHLPYHHSLKITRNDFRLLVLDPIFRRWYGEALMVGLIPRGVPPIDEWRWSWNYDGFASIDPVKDVTARNIALKDGSQTYAQALAEEGRDWQEHFDQLAREKEYAESKGLPWPLPVGLSAMPASSQPAVPPADQMSTDNTDATDQQDATDPASPAGSDGESVDIPESILRRASIVSTNGVHH